MGVYSIEQILKAFIRSLSFASFNTVVCASYSTASLAALVVFERQIQQHGGTRGILRDPDVIQKKKKKSQILAPFVKVAVNIFDTRLHFFPKEWRTFSRESGGDVNGVGTIGRSLHSVYVRDRTHHAGDKGPYPRGVF